MDLTVETSSTSAQRAQRGPQEPMLNVSMTLSTLVLPKLPQVESRTLEGLNLDDPEALRAAGITPLDYLHEEQPLAYNKMLASNIFRIYRPKPPPPRPVARNTTPRKPPPPPPPVDPRRDADKFVLLGTTSLNGELIAYIRDERQAYEPPMRKRLNDPVDDGRIVLVHPKGIVVQVTQGRERGRLFFYPLGRTFKEREPVDPVKHAEIKRLLDQVLNG